MDQSIYPLFPPPCGFSSSACPAHPWFLRQLIAKVKDTFVLNLWQHRSTLIPRELATRICKYTVLWLLLASMKSSEDWFCVPGCTDTRTYDTGSQDWGLRIGDWVPRTAGCEAALSPQSTFLDPWSSVLGLQSSFYGPQSSVLDPWSSTLNPESSVLSPKSLLTVESKKSEHTAFLLQEYWNNCFAKKKKFGIFIANVAKIST